MATELAEVLPLAPGVPKNHCVAAAIVDVVNASRGGKKLASWWRETPRLTALSA